MKSHSNRLLTAVLILILLTFCRLTLAGEAPNITAGSAILIDAATGKILYEKNSHEKRPMASTTKIMTALVTLENKPIREVVEVGERPPQMEGSRLGLRNGDKIPVHSLLKAVMLKSANDAALALAEHVGGSQEGFAKMMNARARELGALETHFVNPHGLHDKEHYTTAYDLALISREAMKLKDFRDLSASQRDTIILDGTELTLTNHNKLLFQDRAVDGIKTGFVRESGRCVVVSANRGGWRLIAVVLNSIDLWGDAETLLNYGFDNWQAKVFASREHPFLTRRVWGGAGGRVPVMATKSLVEIYPLGEQGSITQEIEFERLIAPVEKGQAVGSIRLLRAGQEVDSAVLFAAEKVPQKFWLGLARFGSRIVLVFVIMLVGLKLYGKSTKAARRRRLLLKAKSRAVDIRRARQSERAEGDAAGREGGPELQ